MDVFRGTHQVTRPLREPVVAIGNFDGVHVGHQELLALAVTRAHALGGEACVLTFEPHPAKVLAPRLAPPLISSTPRKLELLAARGIDVTVLEPFTRELAELSPEAFVDEILRAGLGAREVVVGYDFTYGKHRAGTAATLGRAITTHVVPQIGVDGLVASSTKIRELLHEGNVAGARVLLGRPFDVEGEVVRGAGRGRMIGVPTANVSHQAELLPSPGVYAARVLVDGARHDAVLNLGRNPTFVAHGGLSLEAHLLDFDADLYGKHVRVEFITWLRGEERFDGPAALVAQIRADIVTARALLRNA